jgi:Cu-processing system permease protein
VVWFAAVVLFDVAALGVASFLPSGLASRLLIISLLINPVDAVRTGALLGAEGTTAFGAASLAFFRFTGGPFNAALLLATSAFFWITLPPLLAILRLRSTDI